MADFSEYLFRLQQRHASADPPASVSRSLLKDDWNAAYQDEDEDEVLDTVRLLLSPLSNRPTQS